MKGLTKAILVRRVNELVPPFFSEIEFEKERFYIYGMLCALLNEEIIDKEEHDWIADQVKTVKFVQRENNGDSNSV